MFFGYIQAHRELYAWTMVFGRRGVGERATDSECAPTCPFACRLCSLTDVSLSRHVHGLPT